MRRDSSLLRGKMKARRSVHAITIEQGHRGHGELCAHLDQCLGKGRAFEKAECRAGMKFDVHRLSVVRSQLSACDASHFWHCKSWFQKYLVGRKKSDTQRLKPRVFARLKGTAGAVSRPTHLYL